MIIENASDAVFDAVLKEALLLYEQRQSESIPPSAELKGKYPPSERQKARMQKLFDLDRRRDFFKASFAFAKKAAAVFIVASVILSGVLMTSPEVRAAVAETIVKWYGEFVHFVSPNESFHAFDPSDWEFDAPQGFVVAEDTVTPGSRVVVCESENGDDFVLTVSPPDSNVYVDNENARYESVVRGGITYHVFVSDPKAVTDNRVYWKTQNASFLLLTSLPEESMMEIAQSVREKKE
jgi:hypothetical protein